VSDLEKKSNEIFFEVTGFNFYDSSFFFYVQAGSDEETLEYIALSSKEYPDADKAELGYIAVWKYLLENKP
jgi:hypothetical protein